MNRLILVLGGARSGKSRFALDYGATLGDTKTYIATAQPLDAEMIHRIEEHRRERSRGWTTIEEPLDLSGTLKSIEGKTKVAVIDCLTFWLSNLLMNEGSSESKITDEIDRLVLAACQSKLAVVAVSNEVGLGIVPADPLSRRFRDLAGFLHQRWAQVAHEVYWMTAGIPVPIKGGRDAVAAKNS